MTLIQALREEKGISVAYFAKMTHMHASSICHFEAQIRTPYPTQAIRIARALEWNGPIIRLFHEKEVY